MGFLSRFFRRSQKPVVYDLRGSDEKRFEEEGRGDLGGEDEQLARNISDLLSAPLAGGGTKPEVIAELKKLGEYIGANGGDPRMRKVAYRVNTLYPGGARLLEFYWTGICGWHH
jgi:hypothetical protein